MGKNNKIILFFISIFFIFLSVFPNISNVTASNVDYIKSADYLAGQGIINSVQNTSEYNISGNISRIEMLKVIYKISGDSPLNSNCSSKFGDISSSHWGCKYSSWALGKTYIAGNANYRPNANLSKVEALKMIFKVKNIEIESTSDWRVGYVNKAVELGYVEKFSDYNTAATRGFVFDIIYKVINSSGLTSFDFENKKVVVTFDEVVDKTIVENNLQIYPVLSYSTNWLDDKSLEIKIDELIDEDLELLVNTLDSNTNTTVSKTFKITGDPSLTFVSPQGNITDLNKNIVIKFSKPIISLTNIDNQELCPITITPSLLGECHWITTSSFSFKPTNGFVYGAKYRVEVPSGIETFLGQETINGADFTITTPAFELSNYYLPKSVDDKMVFNFNGDVDLENFKENFSLFGYKNSQLSFEYLTNDLGDINKKGIEIFPLSKDWGYSQQYSVNIYKNLVSIGGNISLTSDITYKFTTGDFLASYEVVKFRDNEEEDKYNVENLIYSSSNKYINPDDTNILLTFDKEVELNENLFEINKDFELNYTTSIDSDGNITQNKNQIIVSINETGFTNLQFKVLQSKIANTQDKTLIFQVLGNNTLNSFENISYETSCVTFDSPIKLDSLNYDNISFSGGYSRLSYIYQVSGYSNDECGYIKGKYTYNLSTTLNPNSNYTVTFNKELFDNNLYSLDKDYTFEFTTGDVSNYAKTLNFVYSGDNKLYPEYLDSKTFSVVTKNLDKFYVNICYGDLDISISDFIDNKTCVSKTLDLNNLGFKPNISVFSSDEIIGEDVDYDVYKVTISKLKDDKTQYESGDYFTDYSKTYINSNYYGVLVGSKSNVIYVKNLLDDNLYNISKISLYNNKSNYSILGKYLGTKNVFQKDLAFTKNTDGTYKIGDEFSGNLLITLQNGEKVYLESFNNYYTYSEITNYITTSKPLYKPGEELNLSGLSYVEDFNVKEISQIPVDIRILDPNYNEVYSGTLNPDKNGAFSYDYEIETDAKLGTYRIYVGNDIFNFQVQNYVKPDFELTAEVENDYIKFPSTQKIDVSGKYFAGLNMSNAKVDYRLTSNSNIFTPSKFSDYIFGESKRGYFVSSNEINFETNGSFYLDSDGEYILNLDLDDEENREYELELTLYDSNTNKSVSKTLKFDGYLTTEMVGLKTNKYYYNVGDNLVLDIVGVNLKNNLVKNSSFKLEINKVDYEEKFGGNSYEKVETNLIGEYLKTLETGKQSYSYKLEKYGEYNIILTGNNGFKTSKTIYVGAGNILNPIVTDNGLELTLDKDRYDIGDTANLNIYGVNTGLEALLAITKDGELLDYKFVSLDNNSTDVSFSVKSNYVGGVGIGVFAYKGVDDLEKLEELKSLRLKMSALEQELIENEVEIIPLFLYRDLVNFYNPEIDEINIDKQKLLNQYKLQEAELLNEVLPQYYTGNTNLQTNLERVTLDTIVSLDSDSYSPGDSQKINLTVKDDEGNLVNGNLNITIIDKSLLSLKDQNNDILNFIYPDYYQNDNFFSNIKNVIPRIDFTQTDDFDEDESRYMYKSYDMYDGMVFEESMDMGLSQAIKATSDADQFVNSVATSESSSEESDVYYRSNFKDLAYYNAKIKLVNGKASIDISSLPDNLTTWEIIGFTNTNDVKIGTFQKEFQVQNELSIVPALPKILTVGDQIDLQFDILNNTNSQITGTYTFKSTNLSETSISKEISINANSSYGVSVPVEVLEMQEGQNLEEYFSNIIFSIKSGDYSDGFTDKIKIDYPSTREYVYTNGVVEGLSYEENLDFSKVNSYGNVNLDLNVSPTILNNIDEKLKDIVRFPYYDLGSMLDVYKEIDLLKQIYTKIGKIDIYNEISVYDRYNDKNYSLDELKNLLDSEIPKYLTDKNLFTYYKNCDYSKYNYCYSEGLTKKYLELQKTFDGIDNELVYKAYKNKLIERVQNNQKLYMDDFIVAGIYKDYDFINNYFEIDLSDLSNLEKLEYINIYNNLGIENDNINKFYNELKNGVLIEAKTSFLPGNNYIKVNSLFFNLTNKNSEDDYLTKNILSYLFSELFKDYYNTSNIYILDSVLNYLNSGEELEDVEVSFDGYLNGRSIISGDFDNSNKTQSISKSYLLSNLTSDYENNQLGFETTGDDKLYYDIGVGYYLRSEDLESRDLGIVVERNYYDYDDYNNSYEYKCNKYFWFDYCYMQKVANPTVISETSKGNMIVGEVSITLDKPRKNVVVNDFIPSGFEIINSDYNTTSKSVQDLASSNSNWYDLAEYKYDGVYLYADYLSPGTYTFKYVLQNVNSGRFNLKPAFAQLLDDKQIWGRTRGGIIEVK